MKSTNPVECSPFACSRDGLTIRGTIFRPAAHPSVRKLPVAIISHGFGGCGKDVEPYARFIAGMGFAGIAFDFNGGGPRSTSDGATEDMTVYTESEDLKAVIRAAAEEPDLDAGDVTLMGCSQGGFVSAITAARRRDEVEKLVLFYPALSIPDDSRRGHMLTFRFDPGNIPEILGRVPITLGRDYAAVAQKLDSFDLIAGYDGPVLLVHGTRDHLVPLSYSQRAAEVYGDRCKFVQLAGADHIFHGENAKKAKALVREFVRGRGEVCNLSNQAHAGAG